MSWNAIGRLGLVFIFHGHASLRKLAADNQLMPVELRVAAVAVAGIAMLVFGWRLRISRRGYSLGMQGAGIGGLYLTSFAALRLSTLVSPTAPFLLLALIAAVSARLALAQDA